MPNLCKLGDVFLTVVKEEEYNYSNDITERAMEDGSKVTDHAKSNLIRIRISGIITGKGIYPQENLTKLRLYSLNRNILKYTGIQNFGTVIIEKFNNMHNKDIANGIAFDMTLKEVRIVKKVSVAVNTGKLKIPDIERLKEDLAAQAKLKKQTSAGKKGKTKKVKLSPLEEILTRY